MNVVFMLSAVFMTMETLHVWDLLSFLKTSLCFLVICSEFSETEKQMQALVVLAVVRWERSSWALIERQLPSFFSVATGGVFSGFLPPKKTLGLSSK